MGTHASYDGTWSGSADVLKRDQRPLPSPSPVGREPEGERGNAKTSYMKDCYKTTSPDRYRNLADKAKGMRTKPTEAEKLLWEYLRANRLGAKFRRQHPLGDYIADFVCLEKRLGIELDGKCHEDNTEHDKIRDNELLKLGYRTVRFTNEELFGDIEHVLSTIKKYLDE